MHRFVFAVLAVAGVGTLCASAGPLTPPPGAPAPTDKPLADVEPRIAINAANTPGDVDSVFRIAAPGSYYLTGNIVAGAGDNGIDINANDVVLDLNGYTIRGLDGSLDGIAAFARQNVTIRNGVITDFEGEGIQFSLTAANTLIEHVRVADNGTAGIQVGGSAIVRNCSAFRIGGSGISANNSSLIESCTARENGGDGFSTGVNYVVTHCVARQNGGKGFDLSTASSVYHSNAYLNTDDGFELFDFGHITHCLAYENGIHGISVRNRCFVSECTAIDNTEHGIDVNSGCMVDRCHAAGNVLGIAVVGADSTVQHSHAIGNGTGFFATFGGSLFLANACGASTFSRYDMPAGSFGEFVRAPLAAPAFAGATGGLPIPSNNAFANISY